MARVIALSSQVVRGHIGLSAIVPALQRLGHEVWPIPTVLLSNHPGHVHSAGTRLDPDLIIKLVEALERNGWLAETDAVITGYLPTVDHVRVATRLLDRLSALRPVLYLCDPVLGDEPRGLYVDANAAAALRDELASRADILTPNLFEFGWLAGSRASEPAKLAEAAGRIGACAVLVTSAPAGPDRLANVLLEAGSSVACEVAMRLDVPHGTGDFLGGLFLGHVLNGESGPSALGRTVAAVDAAIAASAGRDELALIPSQDRWADAKPLPVRAL
jgi:pyridoxine kinase